MAEEGTLGVLRASGERDDRDEPSKEELQRRMEEARESISQTVTEIKEAVTNQYNSMKETVTDALDWRHHFRKNPVAFSVGALGVGFLVGYAVAGRLKGDGYSSYEERDAYARAGGATPASYDDLPERHSAFHGHSYAGQPITDGPPGEDAAGDYEQHYSDEAVGEGADDYRRRDAEANYAAAAPEPPEEQRPGLYERFKGTPAYDRLQAEVAVLGDRFIEELSKTAQTVVLPALFNKIKEMFGVDLSGRKQAQQQNAPAQAQRRTPDERSAASSPADAESAQAASASASPASASRGSSYATSENRSYGEDKEARRSSDSILDLDR